MDTAKLSPSVTKRPYGKTGARASPWLLFPPGPAPLRVLRGRGSSGGRHGHRSYGHLASAIGDSESNRRPASSGLVVIAGDLVPGMPVEAGVGGKLRQAAFGLVDEAGEQGDYGQVVVKPAVATFGERCERVVDELVSVVVAVGEGMVMIASSACLSDSGCSGVPPATLRAGPRSRGEAARFPGGCVAAPRWQRPA